MANNGYSATAANILSSLGVKGVSVTGGAGKEGKIPVLNKDGQLELSTLPMLDLVDSLEFPYIENTAYVNPRAGGSDATYKGTGAITSPFRTLDEAAASDKKFSNFILIADAAGKYEVSHPVFKTTESIIRIFSTGTTEFRKLELEWRSNATQFIFWNISTVNELYFISPYSCSVILDGYGKFGKVKGKRDTDEDTPNVTLVSYGPEISVTSFVDVLETGLLATSERIINSSTIVPGTTVKDATDSLGRRRIRIPKFTADDEGIHASLSEDVEVESDSSDDYDLHDIRELGETLADAANETFYKKGDSPTFTTVTAGKVTANTLSANEASTSKIILCGLPLFINADDFLVVGDGETTTNYYKAGGDLYFKSYVVDEVQHYVKQVVEHDAQIGWGANWTGDYILVDGVFINVATGTSDYDSTDDEVEEYYRIGSDLYFKSHVVGEVQHYVKQNMGYDASIGWGAEWVGDYILVDGEFIDVSESSESNDVNRGTADSLE